MQKKLIALAVAGLVSAPAFAQSNVTVYGIVDMGFTNFRNSDVLDYENRSGLDQGGRSGTRLGFKGTEDLGNGVKAGFVIEQGLQLDRSGSGGTTNNYNRETLVTLSSASLGTLALGRTTTPQYNLLAKVDSTQGVGIGSQLMAGGGIYGMGTLGGAVARLDNVAAYISPNFSGLTVTAAFTANGLGDEQVYKDGKDNPNIQVWAISPVYENGPLMVGLNYHKVTSDTIAALEVKDPENTNWDLAGSYDFKVVKLGAAVGQSKLEADNFDGDLKEKKWFVSAAVPVTAAGTLVANYGKVKIEAEEGESDAKVSKWAVGYMHNLSKRTMLYTFYGSLSTNDQAEGAYSVRGYAPDSLGVLGETATQDYTRGFSAGVRHSF